MADDRGAEATGPRRLATSSPTRISTPPRRLGGAVGQRVVRSPSRALVSEIEERVSPIESVIDPDIGYDLDWRFAPLGPPGVGEFGIDPQVRGRGPRSRDWWWILHQLPAQPEGVARARILPLP